MKSVLIKLILFALIASPTAASAQRQLPQRRGLKPGGKQLRPRAFTQNRKRTSPKAGHARPSHIAEKQLARIDYSQACKTKALTKRSAACVVARARKKLRADFQLAWDSESTSIWHDKGKPITVPRGLVERPGLTADGLALILAHEAAHARGRKRESHADYWAAKTGLRKLWGKGYNQPRAMVAAYSALRSLYDNERFDARQTSRQGIELNATGYPTLQSRWTIYKTGTLKQRHPRVIKRQKESAPNLMSIAEAARYLALSPAELARKSQLPDGPMQLKLGGPVQYLKEDLDRFRTRQ